LQQLKSRKAGFRSSTSLTLFSRLARFNIACNHGLPTIPYLNVLNNQSLLATSANFLQSQKRILVHLHHAP
jgi:hypothetical protein